MPKSTPPKSSSKTRGLGGLFVSSGAERERPDRPAATGLQLSHLLGNLTITRTGHVTAWYLASPMRWSFRAHPDRSALVVAHAQRLAELAGRRVHLRVTHRPYPVARWAEALHRSVIDPLPVWPEYLADEQVKMARLPLDDKLVYYGVRIGRVTQVGQTLQRLWAGAVTRQVQSLSRDIDAVDRIMAGPGMAAEPCTAADMDWLMTRSLGLGLPAPVDLREQPTARWDPSDVAEWTDGIQWASPTPYTSALTVSAQRQGRRIERHVTVLTLGRMSWPDIPESGAGPWLQRLDRLPFPYEVSATIDVREGTEATADVLSQLEAVGHQVRHHQEHGADVPLSLGRQRDEAQLIEDDIRNPDGLSTRTRGWYRIAISAPSEDMLHDRVTRVTELYKGHAAVVRPAAQYALAREFVPGEPLSSTAYARRMPVRTLGGSLPAVSAAVGDRRGFSLAYTSGTARRPVTWHPWHAQEVREASGLTAVCGTLGSGKTALCGTIVYHSTIMGAPWVVLDPSGPVRRMCDLPELRSVSRAVDLMAAEPGTLNPYRIVPDPNRAHYTPELFQGEPDPVQAAEAAYRREAARAAGTRRTLAIDVLMGMLPPAIARSAETSLVLHKAAEQADTSIHGSPREIVAHLRKMTTTSHAEHAADIADLLESVAELPQGQLFFPGTDGGDDIGEMTAWRLVVLNMRGISLPNPGTAPEQWTLEEQYSMPLLYLAGWYAQRSIYARDLHDRKGLWMDEAHVMGQVSSGRELLRKTGRDSRKHNARSLLASQDGEDILNSGVGNWLDSVFIGRTTGAEAQRAALRLLGVETGAGYEEILGQLSPPRQHEGEKQRDREFIFSDGAGGIERITVPLQHRPALLAALNSTADPLSKAPAPNPWLDESAAGGGA